MCSKFYLLIAAILVLFFPLELSYSQENKVSLDSLKSGGIYSIILANGKQFNGEFISRDSSSLTFNDQGRLKRIKIVQIAAMLTPEYLLDDNLEISDNTSLLNLNKFRSMLFFNTGISIPTGTFKDIHKAGFGFNASVYHMFDRLIGIGAEFQYNIFPGEVYTTKENDYVIRSESESYSLYSFKANLMIGNFCPEDNFIVYGLFGVGLHYYTDGSVTTISSHQFGTYTDIFPGNSGLSFLFGAGTGLSYRISKKIRINGELQYDKLPKLDYNFAHDYDSNDFDGYFSFRIGIMYTY